MSVPRQTARALAAPALLATAYLTLRLAFLFTLPMMSEEAIHLEWTRQVRFALRPYASVEADDKSPFCFWLVAPFLPDDSDGLRVGRLFGVLPALAALLLTFRIARRMFGERTAILTGLFWLASPMLFFHERLFLLEPWMALLYLAVLSLSLRLAEDRRVRTALALGAVLAVGFASKSYAFFYAVVPPLAFVAAGSSPRGERARAAGLVLLAWGVSAVLFLTLVAEPLIRSGRGLFHDRAYFVRSATGVGDAMAHYASAQSEMFFTLWFYVTPLVTILAVGGLVLALRSGERGPRTLALSAFLPLLAIAAVANVFYARYFYFFTPLLLVLAARCIDRIGGALRRPAARAALTAAFALAVILLPARNTAALVLSPERARMPAMDAWAYVYGTLSGYGVAEVAEFLAERAAEGPISVFTTGHFGNSRDGLTARLWYRPNVRIFTAWWAYKLPVLGPIREHGAVIAAASRHDPAPVAMRLAELGRAFLVLDVPHNAEADFLARNPDARVVFRVAKPGARYGIVVLALN